MILKKKEPSNVLLDRLLVLQYGELANRIEILLAYATYRAHPILGYILKCCSWCDAAIRIAYGWVVNPSAYCTYILFHNICNC